MISLRLALRMLARDWRAGELTVLGIALMLGVAALTSVGFLTDRVEQALRLQSHQLLGGDLLLTADHPWSDPFRREAAARGLRLAESATFPSMVSLGDASVLAEVKAVSPGYPLRGSLRTAAVLNGADEPTSRVPQAGEAWPDERLATTLGLAAGTALAVGRITVQSGPVLTMEPDRGMNVFALAPRLMINLGDLAATGLIQPGSRAYYRLHLAGEAPAVAAYEAWAKDRLGRGEKIESLDNARPEIRNVTERAQRFLRLAALLAVILAAVAAALAAERYMRRHLDGCAVMRCMGASARQLLLIHGGEFLAFGLVATLAGCGVGYAVQLALQQMLDGLLATSLPPPSLLPWLHGLACRADPGRRLRPAAAAAPAAGADAARAAPRMEWIRIFHVLGLGWRLPAWWPGAGRVDAVDGGRAAPGPDRARRIPPGALGFFALTARLLLAAARPPAPGRPRLRLAPRAGQPAAAAGGDAGAGGGAGARDSPRCCCSPWRAATCSIAG